MKKSVLTIALLSAAMLANAEDYKGEIHAYTQGHNISTSTEDATLSIDNTDGQYSVKISKFSYFHDGPQTVDEITLNNVKATVLGVEGKTQTTLLETEQTVNIGGKQMPVIFKATVRGYENNKHYAKATASFNIYGDHIIICNFGDQQYTVGQIYGADFENWHTADYSGGFPKKTYTSDEPDGWHSFMSATGDLSSTVRKNTYTYISNDVRPDAEGSTKCLHIKSGIVKVAIVSQPANGTITTGRLYAGSVTANNPGNNSTSNPAAGDVDSNADPFFTPMGNYPDALSVWVKYKQGKLSDANKEKYPYATMSAVLCDGTKYQDPEDTEYKNVVAKAQDSKIAENGNGWQNLKVDFDYNSYTDNNVEPSTILVTLSTNAEPGVASTDANNPDELFVDDLKLVYNSSLTTFTLGGKTTNIESGKYDYEFDYEMPDDATDLAFTTDAKHAFTSSSVATDADGAGIVTVTVTSNDLSTVNVYTFKYKAPKPADVKTDYEDDLAITLTNGDKKMTSTSKATISVIDHNDDTYDFVLNQFTFQDPDPDGDPMLIGDVTMKNVKGEKQTINGNEYTVFECDDDAEITNGDWVAELLGGKIHVNMKAQTNADGKLFAVIQLPVDMGSVVLDVLAVFGTKQTDDTTAIGCITNPTADGSAAARVYDLSGRQIQGLQNGINIVRLQNGKTVKVVK